MNVKHSDFYMSRRRCRWIIVWLKAKKGEIFLTTNKKTEKKYVEEA